MKKQKLIKRYSHVIVVGVDGAGSFFKNADTPYFDSIFKDGAVTYRALSSKPSISAECWASMLIGVGPEIHRRTNDKIKTKPYPVHSWHPTLFRRIRKAMPEAELGSFCDWNALNTGIVERNVNVTQKSAHDTQLTPMICEYIKEKKPTFLFIHFDSVDEYGHQYGFASQPFMQRLHEVDSLINDVYGAVCQAGILEGTLFTVIADHGGIGCHHGGWTDEEKLTTFAAVGKGVKKGEIGEMNVRDVAAIVLYALGIKAPRFRKHGWSSQIPENLFDDDGIPPYRDISRLTGAEPRLSEKHHE